MKQNASEIAKIYDLLNNLDKKVDMIMGRVMATPSLMSNFSAPKPNNPPPKERVMYKITCADCGKESSLPFKPAADRPVYCKECFTLRRRGTSAGPIKAENSTPNIAPALSTVKVQAKTTSPAVKPKKKTAAKKAAPAKKKTVTKKKK